MFFFYKSILKFYPCVYQSNNNQISQHFFKNGNDHMELAHGNYFNVQKLPKKKIKI